MSEIRVKKAVIKEDLLSITGDFRKAIILNQFIYWSERVSDADKFIEKENEIAKNNGEEERELFYGWIYKTADELAEEVMLGLSASQIRRYVSDLVTDGYISKRTNPKYKWDRTLQYRVNLVKIAKALKQKGYPLSDYRIDIPDDENTNTHPCVINDESEKNQSQSSEQAIPESTDKEYNNRDYNTDNTPNSFSNEKDNSKPNGLELYNSEVGELRTATPELEETNSPKSNITMTLGKRERPSRKHELQDMPTRAKEIAYRLTEDEKLSDKAFDCVKYFIDRYKANRGREHVNLRNDTLERVVTTMLSTITVPVDGKDGDYFENDYSPLICHEVDRKDFEKVIDKYFDTDFSEKTDYSIVHFLNENVLPKIMNKCQLKGDHWYESHEPY